jgi:hypothetical protein
MPYTDIEDCLRRLEDFNARIAAINALFINGHVPAANREQARAMLELRISTPTAHRVRSLA